MLFSLEAFQADHGDALLLHFGSPDNPKFMLIDGGPTANGYLDVIKPRLQQIREQFAAEENDPLPLEMVMVSHIDDDHIVGIQALMKDLKDGADDQIPPPWKVRTLWFNSFDEILGNGDDEIFSVLTAQVAAAGLNAPLPGAHFADPYGAAVIASVPNGRLLRQAAQGLGITKNKGFNGLVMAGEDEVNQLTLSPGLKITVIAPDQERIEALHAKWEQSLEHQPNIEELASLAANSDTSVANLSSIVVLAEFEGKKMLLTGDGRSDHTLEGLERAGLLLQGGTFPVDILKLPHHGSNRNVTQTFFKRVPAKHYVVSANGANSNPDLSTLQMIEAAREGSDDFTIHLTNHSGENDLQEILDEFFDAREDRGRSYNVKFRNDAGENALSIRVDLLDEVTF
jgi:hypothetical protein